MCLYIRVYVYIYICVCVCVCVCILFMFKSKSFQHIAVVSPSLACWGHKDSENYHMSPICLRNSPNFLEQNPNSWTKSSWFQWTPHLQFWTVFVCPCHHQPASALRISQMRSRTLSDDLCENVLALGLGFGRLSVALHIAWLRIFAWGIPSGRWNVDGRWEKKGI